METLLLIVAVLIVIIFLWMNILATFAILLDHTFSKVQKLAQLFFVWLIPLFGAGMIMYLVLESQPDSNIFRWAPWPFRRKLFNERHQPNKNRDENENDHPSNSIKRNRIDETVEQVIEGDS